MDESFKIPYDDVNLSIEDAQGFLDENPDAVIFSTYIDEDYGKMPVEYESIQEALEDETRYGSIWIRNANRQVRVHPDEEEAYTFDSSPGAPQPPSLG